MKDRTYETVREEQTHAAQRLTCRMMAELAITAAYPELANGTAWLAPMEATEGMEKAMSHARPLGDGRYDNYRERDHMYEAPRWTAARDAFLQEPKDNAE